MYYSGLMPSKPKHVCCDSFRGVPWDNIYAESGLRCFSRIFLSHSPQSLDQWDLNRYWTFMIQTDGQIVFQHQWLLQLGTCLQNKNVSIFKRKRQARMILFLVFYIFNLTQYWLRFSNMNNKYNIEHPNIKL